MAETDTKGKGGGGRWGEDCVFGPVPSRRLGLSLGVDLLVPKTCTLDCVYCECGPTPATTLERRPWRETREVLGQVERRLAQLTRPPDFVTLAGWGEPTLHSDLGGVLAGLRRITDARLAVLTNATLTPDAEVRAALALADVVVPSLDAVSPEVFQAINRPHPGLDPAAMIEGIAALRREMAGEVWLEILLAQGYNDAPAELALLREAAAYIAPQRIQLNTVVRPPALRGVRPVPPAELAALAAEFTPKAEVSLPSSGSAGAHRGELMDQVAAMTSRRPCTAGDVARMAGLEVTRAEELVAELTRQGRLQREEHDGLVYYRGV